MRIKNLPSIESMDGSQDALVIEQTDGSEDKSRKVSPAQIKQYVLGNSIDDIYSVMGQNGAKNLNSYPYNETSHTDNGIAWTDNGDGTVTANNTATGNSGFVCHSRVLSSVNKLTVPNGTYILSGCPIGGSSTTFNIGATITKNGSAVALGTDNGSGAIITINGDDNYTDKAIVQIICNIKSGVAASNLTFKPMLRLASDTDNTYQPYAKTNKELTEVIGDLSQTGLTGNSVAGQLGDASGKITGINSRLTSMNSFRIGNINGSSGTLVQQCVAFAQNIKNTYGMIDAFEGMFYYSESSRPSDIPSNEIIWTYASGKFLIRTVNSNNIVDATIILFAYDSSKMAIKTVANNAQGSDWVILGA